jgi:hypothetical protein
MANITRKTHPTGQSPTVINAVRYATFSEPVYPSADIEAGVPVRVEWNNGRGRFECVPAGGASLAAGHVHERVHGWTFKSVKFSTGAHAEAVTLVVEGEFSGISNLTTKTNPQNWYLSTTPGVLRDDPAYAGAPAIATRMCYHDELGEKVVVRTFAGLV